MIIALGASVSGVFYCPFLMQTNMTSLQLNTKINIMYNNSDTEIIFSSNNSLEIPALLSSMQTINGILQPIGIWGTQSRAKAAAATLFERYSYNLIISLSGITVRFFLWLLRPKDLIPSVGLSFNIPFWTSHDDRTRRKAR